MAEKHEREREECEKQREECKKHEKKEAAKRGNVNKAFEKIDDFDDKGPSLCLTWLEQIYSMTVNYPDRNYREELLLNSGGSVTKTIHDIHPESTPEQIKDIILCNHSNL